MVFLHSHGVSTSRAFRIYKTYGIDAVEKVCEDPYRLARDIHGIGFKTADKIAESLGIDKQSLLRAQAGIEYVLQELTNEGHCGCPRDELIEAAVKVLEIPAAIVESGLEQILQQGRVVRRHSEGGSVLIYLGILDVAEQELATNLCELSHGSHPCAEIKVDKAIEWVEQRVGLIIQLAAEAIPKRFGFDRISDIQVLTPMQKGSLGCRNLNLSMQAALNPSGPSIERYGWTFRVGDKVMQTVNNYDKDVFNGDSGRIVRLDDVEQELVVRFDGRDVVYDFNELDELMLSYAVTVHKSQGSEYPAVIIPIHTQHYVLLQRNLLYTAITRGRKLAVLVGTRKAIGIAVKQVDSRRRITLLKERLASELRANLQ